MRTDQGGPNRFSVTGPIGAQTRSRPG